jgi:hypothetical protein
MTLYGDMQKRKNSVREQGEELAEPLLRLSHMLRGIFVNLNYFNQLEDVFLSSTLNSGSEMPVSRAIFGT